MFRVWLKNLQILRDAQNDKAFAVILRHEGSLTDETPNLSLARYVPCVVKNLQILRDARNDKTSSGSSLTLALQSFL